MSDRLRIALTADLHWGSRMPGDEATRRLRDALFADPPDVLVLAGDIGTARFFADCLDLFAELPSRKAVVPGNHDIWVVPDDPRGDSLTLYRETLARLSVERGYTYLDHGPLVLPDVALVGTMNWYDYSWAADELRRQLPDWEARVRFKTFSRGRHNDARYVRWTLDDVQFTAEVVAAFERHLEQALAQVGRAVIVTHHPPFYGLSFPRTAPPTTIDGLLWDAFAGNRALEVVLEKTAERIAFAFCGHTHRARENTLGPIRGYNIGGDYTFKRLLTLHWPEGRVEAREFGEPTPPDVLAGRQR